MVNNQTSQNKLLYNFFKFVRLRHFSICQSKITIVTSHRSPCSYTLVWVYNESSSLFRLNIMVGLLVRVYIEGDALVGMSTKGGALHWWWYVPREIYIRDKMCMKNSDKNLCLIFSIFVTSVCPTVPPWKPGTGL